MRLISARLENACQYELLEAVFQPGINAVTGPNGSGKSNLIKMIYASLTGDFSRNAGQKQDNICDKIRDQPKGRSSIETRWEHGGTEFTLLRSLKPDRSELRAGEQVFTRVAEISQWLEELLGMDLRILDRYVFVDQGKMADFLTVAPAERERTFAVLCGTTHYERLWEELGKVLIGDEAVVNAGPGADLTQLEERIGEARRALQQADAQQLEARGLLWPLAQRKEVAKQIEQAAVNAQRRQSLARAIDDLKQATASRHAWLTEDTRLKQQLSEAEVLAKELNAEAEVARAEVAKAKQQFELRDHIQDVRKRLAEAEKTVAESPRGEGPADEAIAALDSQIEELNYETSRREEFIEKLEGQTEGTCPMCGTEVTDLPRKLRDAKRELADWHRQQQAACRERLDAIQLQKKIQRRQSAEGVVAHLNKDLAKLSVGSLSATQEQIGLWSDAIGQAGEHANLLAEIGKAALRADHELTAAMKRRQQLRKQRTELEDQLRGAPDSAVDLQSLRDQLEAQDAIREQLARMEGARLGVVEALARDEQQLAEQKVFRKQRNIARKWVAVVRELRGVFHRSALPRLIADQATEQIVARTNELLEQFDDPFHITSEAGLKLWAHKPGHEPMPAERLSGGEQVVLSIAFRLAMNLLFAQQAGLLVLDEPTVFLDDDNLNYLADALGHLRRLSSSTGHQIIIITHEERLAGVFDHVVAL